MSKREIVVIPVHKHWEDLNENEKQSTLQTLKVLSSRDIVFIGPEPVAEDYLKLGNFIKLGMSSMSYSQYNALCRSEDFYKIFLETGYSYMVIVHQDVWVFEDRLNYFLDEFDKKGYDFIGAPWYGVTFGAPDGMVGNGGGCIRRLSTFRDICRDNPQSSGNEDTYFLFRHGNRIRVTPEKLALEFSFEEKPSFAYKLTGGKLPMMTHAYASTPDRISFWNQFIPNIWEIKCKAGRMDIYDNPSHKIGDND